MTRIRDRAFLWTAALVVALSWCAWADARSDSPVVAAELPHEARQTLKQIQAGGPFPYERDGTVFNNYERLLPARVRGYYREYTVPPPAGRQRGTRRFVVGCERRGVRQGDRPAGASATFAGCDGPAEIYYTEDHYRSFRRVVP